MAVSTELLCSFELLKPLDSAALKTHIKKGRHRRNNMLNSPVSLPNYLLSLVPCTDSFVARPLQPPECLSHTRTASAR